MKTTLIALFVLSTLTLARAQQPPPAVPVPPSPSTPAPPPLVPRPRPQEVLNPFHESVRAGLAAADEAVAAGARAAARALPGTEELETKLQEIRTFAAGSSLTRVNRTLAVLSGEADAAALSNTEEDLAIMARILDKAARSSPDDGRRYASGIEVDGAVFGSSSGARNIFLEGYGALFLLSVKYPLIAPPEKPEAPRVKDTSSDDWKRAREEIQGTLHDGRADLWIESYGRTARGPAEEFDPDKVEKLKDSLIDALKNATHIRALKPNDYVTVVVQGAEGTRTDVVRESKTPRTAKEKDANAGANYSVNAKGYIRRSTGQGQTVMTLRVKKSDADAFAQGKFNPEEFRKKVAIQTYFRKSDAGGAANFYMQTVR